MDDHHVGDATAEVEIVVLNGSDVHVVWTHGAFQHFDLVRQFLERRKCSNGMEARQRVHGPIGIGGIVIGIGMNAKPVSDAVEFHGAGFDAAESDATVATDATDALETDVFVADKIGAAAELSADVVKSMDGDVGVSPHGSYDYGTAVEAHHIVAFHIEAAAPGQPLQSHPSLCAVPPNQRDRNIDISIRCSVCDPSVP